MRRVADCVTAWVCPAVPQPIKRQHIGNQINAAFVFARANVVHVHHFAPWKTAMPITSAFSKVLDRTARLLPSSAHMKTTKEVFSRFREALCSSIVLRAILLLSCIQVGASAFAAGAATWNLDPSNGDWDTDANWTPAGVPSRIATFDVSNITDLTFSRSTTIGNIVFNPAADSYSFTSLVNSLSIQGGGVTNNSGVVQNFVADADDNGNTGSIVFHGATAGTNVAYRSRGRRFSDAGSANTQFQGGSADQAIFTNKGALASGGLGEHSISLTGQPQARLQLLTRLAP
jgi:hypothetical protein